MASKNSLGVEKDNNNLKYLQEGMHDWIEVKEKSGYSEIKSLKKIEKEINNFKDYNQKLLIKKLTQKLKSLNVKKDTLEEFEGIFLTS